MYKHRKKEILEEEIQELVRPRKSSHVSAWNSYNLLCKIRMHIYKGWKLPRGQHF